MTMPSGLRPLVAAPPSPDAGSAQREMSGELRDPVYWTTWWDQFQGWLSDRLLVTAGEVDLTRVLFTVLTLVALALVLGVGLWWWRRRRPRTEQSTEAPVFDGEQVLTAAAYRERAEAHEQAGRAGAAVLDRYRAIGARAVERGLLIDAPDLTAREVGAVLGRAFPTHAEAARRAGAVFDRVRYGDGQAGADDAAALRRLDLELEDATPQAARGSSGVLAVPR